MNVSADTLNILADMLTGEQFKQFKRRVAMENCPGLAFASEWVESTEFNEFVEQLALKADDLGYVTFLDVASVIENGSGKLFFSKYHDNNGNLCQVYGTEESIVKFANEHEAEYMRFCANNLTTSWNPYRFTDCVKTFVQYLVRLDVLVRTEYAKDTVRGGTARCYSINRNR